jgi:two-component system, NtrC family, response regulator GlrR
MPPKRTPSLASPTPDVPAAGIVFLHPVDAPSFVPFPPGRMVLGRDPAAGLPLDGSAVSWQHAELVSEGGDTIIRDLDSTNGVIVDGHRVREARLSPGALVRIGDFLGMVTTGPLATVGALFPEAKSAGFILGPVLGEALAPLAALTANRGALISVEGETGTGKSMVGRLVHARLRPEGPFVAVDCATLDDGAGLAGVLEAAARGVAFLGNFTTLVPVAQTRLADALRARGAGKLCLVAGSQEPLANAALGGDLLPGLHEAFTRIAVRLPPLRERTLEIPALFRQLLTAHPPAVKGNARAKKPPPSLSTELVERLCLYDWPCNVREMLLMAQRLLALHGDEPRLRVSHLPARLMSFDREGTTLPVAPIVTGVDLGKLLDAVRDAGGNIGGAAHRLGISRERAYRLIDRLGLVRGSA